MSELHNIHYMSYRQDINLFIIEMVHSEQIDGKRKGMKSTSSACHGLLVISVTLVHTYNTQEASREAINAAFSCEVDSLVSL